MATQVHACGNCEKENLPSVCSACANRQLQEKYKLVNALQKNRDSLYKRLDEKLELKREAAEQQQWRQTHAERIAYLKERLRLKKNQLLKEKSELEEKTAEYNTRKGLQDEAYAVLETNREKQLKSQSDRTCTQISYLREIQVELWQNHSVILKQLCKVFPVGRVRKPKPNEGKSKESSSSQYHDQICNVTLPKGLDPSSVTPLELAVSLGYMVQLLNLAALYLYAPLLIDSGFACSTSRVWQRASYWNSRPAASKYNRLFFPGQNYSESPKENDSKHPSKSESSSNRDLASRDLVIVEGLHLLKRAVACVTDYCCNSLGLPVPIELSTFDAFGKLLTFLSSKDEVTASIMSSKHLKGTHSSIMSSKDLEGSHSRNTSQAQQNPTSIFIHSNEIAKQKRAEGSGGIAEQKRAEGSSGSNIEGNTTLPLQLSDEDFKDWVWVKNGFG